MQQPRLLPILAIGLACVAEADDGAALQQRCLSESFPETRSDFPALLNCLGLLREAVEVGVQAGVHASDFLKGWEGRHLRLVDRWGNGGGGGAAGDAEARENQLLYVDIANIHGPEVGRQHRARCEARLAEPLGQGRAEVVNLDSTVAAALIGDGELDFVYLDARHDFMGVVADIRAWWPKVRVGGVFAGHDFVDGEFPEGDFFWRTALKEVLPGLEAHTHVTREKNRYPSFFIVKTEALAGVSPRALPADSMARRLYAERSRYFQLWRGDGNAQGFGASCRNSCGRDCDDRVREFTPTRTAGSTLRPFACGGKSSNTGEPSQAASDSCAAELVVDVKAYHEVCIERCSVTCQQRQELFSTFGAEIMAA